MKKILALAAAMMVIAGLATVSPAFAHTSAHATPVRVLHVVAPVNGHLPPGSYILTRKGADPDEVCEPGGSNPQFCLNEWNGDGLVKAYTGQVTNDNFRINCGSQNCNIQNENDGLYIGDYQNNQGDAKAGMVNYGGWGTAFFEVSQNGCGYPTFQLKNVHWNAWLAFSLFDGAQAYLNTGDLLCFQAYSY